MVPVRKWARFVGCSGLLPDQTGMSVKTWLSARSMTALREASRAVARASARSRSTSRCAVAARSCRARAMRTAPAAPAARGCRRDRQRRRRAPGSRRTSGGTPRRAPSIAVSSEAAMDRRRWRQSRSMTAWAASPRPIASHNSPRQASSGVIDRSNVVLRRVATANASSSGNSTRKALLQAQALATAPSGEEAT